MEQTVSDNDIHSRKRQFITPVEAEAPVYVPDRNVTVCYNAQTKQFNATFGNCGPSVVAFANFTNAINRTGWSYLEVVTYGDGYDNDQQAYAAGLAEGKATAPLIDMHWDNTVAGSTGPRVGVLQSSETVRLREYNQQLLRISRIRSRDRIRNFTLNLGYCDGAFLYCQRLGAYLRKNLEWLQSQIEQKGANSTYWDSIKVSLMQLAGLQDGYSNAWRNRAHLHIAPFKLLMLQISGELEDLEQALGKPKHMWKRTFGSGSCSAFIKAVPGGDLWVAHDTWSGYNSMLRVQKMYNFAFRTVESQKYGCGAGSSAKNCERMSEKIPGNTMTMSSYPGTLISIDDFYVISSGLVVTETTIGNSNESLWKFVTPSESVPTWIRTMVANRLAITTTQWAKLFSVHNSGTYNNQWMVVDYKMYSPGKKLPAKGLFRIVEQLPGYIESADMTKLLTTQGYWPSYNIAYFPKVYNLSGQVPKFKQHGDFFSYKLAPRAQIFAQRWTSVKNQSSLVDLMRYNDFKRDPLAACNCTPPYSGENAIAARCDLNPQNGSYPFETLGFRCHGATDLKATNSNLLKKFRFLAQMGPTFTTQPAFNWSSSPCASRQRHVGQPNVFRFGPEVHSWQNI